MQNLCIVHLALWSFTWYEIYALCRQTRIFHFYNHLPMSNCKGYDLKFRWTCDPWRPKLGRYRGSKQISSKLSTRIFVFLSCRTQTETAKRPENFDKFFSATFRDISHFLCYLNTRICVPGYGTNLVTRSQCYNNPSHGRHPECWSKWIVLCVWICGYT